MLGRWDFDGSGELESRLDFPIDSTIFAMLSRSLPASSEYACSSAHDEAERRGLGDCCNRSKEDGGSIGYAVVVAIQQGIEHDVAVVVEHSTAEKDTLDDATIQSVAYADHAVRQRIATRENGFRAVECSLKEDHSYIIDGRAIVGNRSEVGLAGNQSGRLSSGSRIDAQTSRRVGSGASKKCHVAIVIDVDIVAKESEAIANVGDGLRARAVDNVDAVLRGGPQYAAKRHVARVVDVRARRAASHIATEGSRAIVRSVRCGRASHCL